MNFSRHVRWLVLYWMPYDNDLARFEQPIVEMLRHGVISDDVVVVVQSDNPSADQMTRTIIRAAHTAVEAVTDQDSSHSGALEAYLHWARERFDAERWAIVFLGHGGRLDEFSPDARAGECHAGYMRWMKIDAAARAIAALGADHPVELVFLQNCCKGTLEAHYAFRKAARYTLSSQTLVGAPNGYYEPALNALSRQQLDGASFAAQIMDHERSDMFNGYVLTNNAAFDQLPRYLDPLIAALLASGQTIPSTLFTSHRYAGDRLVDLRHFFEAAVQHARVDRQPLLQFLAFYEGQLIRASRESPATRHPGLSGLSLYLPPSREQADTYADLDIYSDTALLTLWRTLLASNG